MKNRVYFVLDLADAVHVVAKLLTQCHLAASIALKFEPLRIICKLVTGSLVKALLIQGFLVPHRLAAYFIANARLFGRPHTLPLFFEVLSELPLLLALHKACVISPVVRP